MQNDFSSSGDASNNRLDMLTKTLRRGMKNKQDYFTKERQRRQSTPFIHWEKTTLNLQKQKQQSKNGRGDVTSQMKGAILEKITMTMQKKVNEEVMPVYDLESKAWKSFRWDSIKEVRFIL
jgi:hypothetical protein